MQSIDQSQQLAETRRHKYRGLRSRRAAGRQYGQGREPTSVEQQRRLEVEREYRATRWRPAPEWHNPECRVTSPDRLLE